VQLLEALFGDVVELLVNGGTYQRRLIRLRQLAGAYGVPQTLDYTLPKQDEKITGDFVKLRAASRGNASVQEPDWAREFDEYHVARAALEADVTRAAKRVSAMRDVLDGSASVSPMDRTSTKLIGSLKRVREFTATRAECGEWPPFGQFAYYERGLSEAIGSMHEWRAHVRELLVAERGDGSFVVDLRSSSEVSHTRAPSGRRLSKAQELAGLSYQLMFERLLAAEPDELVRATGLAAAGRAPRSRRRQYHRVYEALRLLVKAGESPHYARTTDLPSEETWTRHARAFLVVHEQREVDPDPPMTGGSIIRASDRAAPFEADAPE